ncbi:hypothetical protein SAMN05216419_101818 [Nitrosomonas cryotolerans]|uniref:ATP-grasp domain-containing protein n=1 Tax=Nitrosomonas cryotolerans ATCC 49181 TaxID=1131553 RepID=A0A1N6FUT2_9PROT|nr:hypothetical protein [Nitrosomonas cryotolerans]SFP76513.1 hypothetical protein SAMN05216419_101818 [Nitrosomonas cryotolerans]SIN99018.1 hypothetical protein SAMN02743940_0412 [Nitrosomonas cryotolerans ATCC 49181]
MTALRLVLGNKPDWTTRMIPLLTSDFEVASTLLKIDHAEWADIVVPLHLSDYEILRATSLFQGKALFPAPETVALCHDKRRFRDWFRTHFDPVYLPAQTVPGSGLLIARPCESEWGVGAVLVESNQQGGLVCSYADSDMFTEEYITGHTEFAQHVLFDDGHVLYSALSTYEHAADRYVRGVGCGPTRTTLVETDIIPSIFVAILSELNYSGTACIDYKIDATGQIKIFEINPRMGGSLAGLAHSYVATYAGYLRYY